MVVMKLQLLKEFPACSVIMNVLPVSISETKIHKENFEESQQARSYSKER